MENFANVSEPQVIFCEQKIHKFYLTFILLGFEWENTPHTDGIFFRQSDYP